MSHDPAAQEPLSPTDSGAPRSVRVLVAEPDPQLRALYTDVLQQAGYEVISVADPAQAPAEAGQLLPALIIAQLVEPTQGFGLCRKIRSETDTRDTPVIVLTRFDDPYTREQIVRSGASAILVEPLRRTLLLRQVRRLLARAKAHGDAAGPLAE